MNKLYKFLIAGIFTIIGIGSFCSSELLSTVYRDVGGSTGTGQIVLDTNSVYCIYASYSTASRKVFIEFQNYSGILNTYAQNPGPLCFNVGNNDNILKYEFQGGSHVQLYYTKVMEYTSCDYSDYLTQEQCNEQYSGYIEKSTINSEYCLNNNLCYSCPTINKGYCKSEYNLIEPSECPICEGSGSINWSSLYINGTQYNSNEIIDIHTEQQMQTSIEYSNTVADIDISYGQDEEYLDNVISYTQMTPTNEDLATLLSNGLETYAPYLFIGLLLIFTIALIKKFFRG